MEQKFDSNAEKQAVWETLKTVNRLWGRDNRPEALAEYFHAQMIAVCGGESIIRTDGRACLDGWAWFCREAKDIRFEERDPHIALFCDGAVAVAAYFFECAYTMGGKSVVMKGRDLFTLIKENGRWRIVADHFSPLQNS